MQATAIEFKGNEGKVTSVILKSGEELKADVVVIGAGIRPSTAFVKESDMIKKSRDQSFLVDKYLKVTDGLYAAGDVASYPLVFLDNKIVRIEHWGMSQIHGKIAALNMLGKTTPCDKVPVFWTTQYGKSLRYCGHAHEWDELVFDKESDGLEKLTFVAYYVKDDKILAVASMNKDPIVAQCAQLMGEGKMPSAKTIKEAIAKDKTSSFLLQELLTGRKKTDIVKSDDKTTQSDKKPETEKTKSNNIHYILPIVVLAASIMAYYLLNFARKYK
eukprot:TRINITY_DN9414_c0_g1_i3.p1 TRINITY_DN9414_c0_g1~~TRINITY_DN9414_c0_g1_i3.p1  ORF type:complete len:273 (+),score=55.27 TRINITY_DN9414_c0_g1_i3:399-1217(+)